MVSVSHLIFLGNLFFFFMNALTNKYYITVATKQLYKFVNFLTQLYKI